MRLGVALYIFASLPVGKSYRVVNELKTTAQLAISSAYRPGTHVADRNMHFLLIHKLTKFSLMHDCWICEAPLNCAELKA